MLGICLALLALDNIQIGEIGSRAKVVALCDGNEGVLFAQLEGLGGIGGRSALEVAIYGMGVQTNYYQ